jgi:hypothetical protein
MAYIHEILSEEGTGQLRELYDQDLNDQGYIDQSTRIFSQRPDVLADFRVAQRKVRTHLRLRRYELVTIAAARAIGCKF